jgi:diguanylate cyclase (GGDEF)-like protein
VPIDQLALLLAVVVAANLVLLLALELPRIGRRRTSVTDQVDAGVEADGWAERSINDGPGAGGATVPGVEARVVPTPVYQRVVRVVSFLFLGAVLVVATVTGGPAQIAVYLLLALGFFLVVLFQELLPARMFGRARTLLEAGAAVLFLTALLILTGGYASPYFFGFVLLVGGAALWSAGYGPPLLAGIASAAYVIAVLVAGPVPLSTAAVGQVAFNLVALALITYVAAVIGREYRRAREEALSLSRFDHLTGLYSRAYLAGALEQEIRRAARSGRPFGLLMIDLDGLKAANDRFGHESGDRLLRAVGDIVRRDVRATDVPARYAGDEFVLILPETDLNGAALVADKIRVDISRLALAHDRAVMRTTASIGLVTYPEDGRTAAELLRRADLAMYEAKRRGRDQIVRFARQAPPDASPPPVSAPASAAPQPATALPQAPPAPPIERPLPRPSTGPAPWETVAGYRREA